MREWVVSQFEDPMERHADVISYAAKDLDGGGS
jgi:hypothetical protein